MPLFDSRLIVLFTVAFFISAAFLADGASSLPY